MSESGGVPAIERPHLCPGFHSLPPPSFPLGLCSTSCHLSLSLSGFFHVQTSSSSKVEQNKLKPLGDLSCLKPKGSASDYRAGVETQGMRKSQKPLPPFSPACPASGLLPLRSGAVEVTPGCECDNGLEVSQGADIQAGTRVFRRLLCLWAVIASVLLCPGPHLLPDLTFSPQDKARVQMSQAGSLSFLQLKWGQDPQWRQRCE